MASEDECDPIDDDNRNEHIERIINANNALANETNSINVGESVKYNLCIVFITFDESPVLFEMLLFLWLKYCCVV